MRLNRSSVIQQLQEWQNSQSSSEGSTTQDTTEQVNYDSLSDEELQTQYTQSGLFEQNYPNQKQSEIEGFEQS